MANKTDFLRFSANSIKELITQKLSSDKKLTDQIYEGSNVSILIDMISYMYQCLVYQLNNAASESMFSDTQIYENMSRLVRMLGYNPKGIIPSQGTFLFDNINSEGEGGKYADKVILPFSYINTGKTDSRGKQITFSTIEQYNINSDMNYSLTMYNGKWKMYPEVFTASGSDYETFSLGMIGSSINENKLVANNMIRIYIKSGNVIDNEWRYTDTELFTDNDFNSTQYGYIIDNTQKLYNIRLNENKNYEIKFGNGTLGQKLNQGDVVYVFYLETNGMDGQVTPDDIDQGVKFNHKPADFGISDSLYKAIFGENSVENAITNQKESPTVYINNTTTEPQSEESVETIRNIAPQEFRLGKRLVTAQDYEYFVKNKWKGQVIDVKCQNNFEYIAKSFYIWLYRLGVQKHNNPRYYINEIDLTKYGYKYSDPSDANNVYLWTKLYEQEVKNVQARYKEEMEQMKDLTHEIVFMEPINVQFSICAAPEERVMEYFKTEDTTEADSENWLEITLDNNSVYVNSVIQNQIVQIIKEFFDQTKQSLGGKINYNNLLNRIFAINGVQKVRTVYQPKQDDGYVAPTVRDGICFATWSSNYIQQGDDLEVSNISKKLEDFQFPVLFDQNLEKKIKVIKKSLSNSSKVQY